MDISYDTINSLDEVAFIAGTEYTFTFYITDSTGSPIDLTGATCKWLLSYYGNTSFNVLEKSGVVLLSPTNAFTVSLVKNDTKLLSGKFIQQPVVIDVTLTEFRPSQGVITILPAIPLI